MCKCLLGVQMSFSFMTGVLQVLGINQILGGGGWGRGGGGGEEK